MSRNCNDCIHRVGAGCSAWTCEHETLAEHDAKKRVEVIDEVYRAWVDFNSGKYDEEYFDFVIDRLKEQKE